MDPRRNPSRRLASSFRRVPLWFKLLLILCATLLPGASCTCANQEYSRAYKRALERGLEDYVHQGEVDVLRADIEAHLTQVGYVPGEAKLLGLETQWRALDPEQREMVEARILPASGGFSVTLTRISQRLSPQRWELVGTDRRGDIELALVAALDPEQAKKLSAETASDHRYTQTPKEVWTQLESVAVDRHFLMEGFEAPIDASATSMWVEDEHAKQRSRLEVRFQRHGSASDQLGVEISERSERAVGERVWTDAGEERDIDLELGLVRHRDPTQATKIEQEAGRAGQDAYDDAIERGAPPGCSCVPY